ncbi:MAG: hypothetical protein V4561_11055 [Bacteroidota bacterium]
MKKLHLLIFAALTFIVISCTKEYPEPVYTPEKNTWLVNTDTFGPSNFKYYDTANLMYGGIKGVGSVTIKFREKPKTDGEYVFREKADEVNELSILIIDSVSKLYWQSTDNDGLALKAEQFANVTVNGSNIGVAFNNKWLKRTDNVDKAKVSINIE